jgi:hypothetical protein
MGRRIHIVGCAKTGTTLLQRLFVTKRSIGTVFSYHLTQKAIARQLETLRNLGVELVYTTRNRESVIHAKVYPQSPTRYDACQRQAFHYSDRISAMVRFESLVEKPDEVQAMLASLLGLKATSLWSAYPDFVPSEAFDLSYGDRYSPRRIGDEPEGQN